MNKLIFTIALCGAFASGIAQSIDTDFYPKKTNSVSSRDYNKGIADLAYAYSDINKNPSRKLDYIDYWRVAVAYIYMGVDKETVYKFLLKSKENNSEGFCTIINAQLEADENEKSVSRFQSFLGAEYIESLNDCGDFNLKPTKFPSIGKSSSLEIRRSSKPNQRNKDLIQSLMSTKRILGLKNHENQDIHRFWLRNYLRSKSKD